VEVHLDRIRSFFFVYVYFKVFYFYFCGL